MIDNLSVLVEEDRVLFAGDTAMSLPYIVDGDIDVLTSSLKRVAKMGLENIVQGHGDIVLRGEIENYIKDNLNYLANLRKVVRRASRRKYPLEILDETTVDMCGKSRVLIGGLASELHRRNLRSLYRKMFGEPPIPTDDDEEYYDEDEEEYEEDAVVKAKTRRLINQAAPAHARITMDFQAFFSYVLASQPGVLCRQASD